MEEFVRGSVFHFNHDIMFWLRTCDLSGKVGAVCLTTGVYLTVDELREKGYDVDNAVFDGTTLDEFLREDEDDYEEAEDAYIELGFDPYLGCCTYDC